MTVCDPLDYSLPGSPVCRFLQARIWEWVAISFSRGSSRPRDRIWVSCIGRWILYHWATRDAQIGLYMTINGHLLTHGALPHSSKSNVSWFDISDILLPYFSDIFIHKVKFYITLLIQMIVISWNIWILGENLTFWEIRYEKYQHLWDNKLM